MWHVFSSVLLQRHKIVHVRWFISPWNFDFHFHFYKTCFYRDLQYVWSLQSRGADKCSCCASCYLRHPGKNRHIQSCHISMVTVGLEACHKKTFLPPWKCLCLHRGEIGARRNGERLRLCRTPHSFHFSWLIFRIQYNLFILCFCLFAFFLQEMHLCFMCLCIHVPVCII